MVIDLIKGILGKFLIVKLIIACCLYVLIFEKCQIIIIGDVLKTEVITCNTCNEDRKFDYYVYVQTKNEIIRDNVSILQYEEYRDAKNKKYYGYGVSFIYVMSIIILVICLIILLILYFNDSY